MKLRFRRLNQFWAWYHGYFWLPCPICGEMFGGHEWKFRDVLIYSTMLRTERVGVCRMCGEEARRRNRQGGER